MPRTAGSTTTDLSIRLTETSAQRFDDACKAANTKKARAVAGCLAAIAQATPAQLRAQFLVVARGVGNSVRAGYTVRWSCGVSPELKIAAERATQAAHLDLAPLLRAELEAWSDRQLATPCGH
ncbi:hypothetical protein BX589_10160 [Paraburkholderia fungorum]|jgi:hypothetical protein|uniref:hypothetical protein n=1 Tax=Paraburkholderia fungorum TaxID=134537 RepID=UPI000D06DE70|nr:hypothetical protein [Paraburkholderia fungorum]PRZ56410.1 hypothetical protein BX589_10160 [Paraburkholderia fungorum]